MGALGGVAVTIWTGTVWPGVVAAILTGCLMAGLHAVVTVGLRSNQVVSGLALTLLGGGLSAFLGRNLVGDPMPDKFTDWSIPLLGDIPKVGEILFDHDPLVYLSYIVAPVLWYWLFRTQPGLHLRAIGDNPAAADAMGVPVNWLRFLYVIVGGGFAGLGGAVISLGTNPGWTEGITAGRGWIAVALVIFAAWNPARAAVGAYLFGGVEAGQFRLQTAGVDVSSFFLNMLPYLFTILVLVLSTRESTRRILSAPAALGRPYTREDRG
jgi:simple sugar transport system permease protein